MEILRFKFSSKHIIYCTIIFPLLLFYPERIYSQSKNVIIISIDDLNDWIEPYHGNTQIKTPSFDRLSDLGITFLNCWPAVPWCNPSRVSMLTGIHPLRSGIITNGSYPFRNHLRYAKTLIQHFAESGYYTYGAGKIFHKDDAMKEKWDEFYSNNFIPSPLSVPANELTELVKVRGESFDWDAIDAPLEEWGDYNTTIGAIEFMEKWQVSKSEKPFLMILGYRFPHLPWYYPRQFEVKQSDQNIDMPVDFVPKNYTFISKSYKIIKEAGKWEEAVESYVSSLNFLDFNIGLILDSFLNTGLSENTILIVFSDHGYHLGEKGRWEKVTLWNESLISPLFVYIPELTSDKKYVTDPVSLLDIYPTLIESCQLSPNQFVDGKSLINNILGINLSNSDIYQTSITLRGAAISDKSYKYFYENNFEGFYNILEDENELNNLAYSEDISIQNLKNQYNYILKEHINSFDTFEIPKTPVQIEVRNDSGDLTLTWDKGYKEKVFYEVMLAEDSKFKKYSIERSDTNMFLLDTKYMNRNFIKIRALNPKYKSDWSSTLEINYSLQELLAHDPVISIYDLNGKLLRQPSKYSDPESLLKRLSGSYYIFKCDFQNFTLHKKLFVQ